MNLVDAYQMPGAHRLLYKILSERTPEQSISHKGMPPYEDHIDFVNMRPYPHWYILQVDGPGLTSGGITRRAISNVGSVYLTKRREIGVAILKTHRGRGYGKQAVQELMRLHPGPCLANINPHNIQSARLFHSLGFNLLQVTYAST